ncbi:CaiB/BaiF CoA transferase family protein [Nocardioides carbamazepini]|uniref:CaiB/BaiF CoA transferase family protein n=1 Tax=Nocardioides carbamazepini TaxID=2854259 RepID=UPI002149B09C|nr:CaiB/BaiF CoA-transferase family protein [Nocardioides carbamazepini]
MSADPREIRTPKGALAGVRVVEFAGLAPGPFAAMMLADHGAEVIRIDRRSPTVPDPDLLGRGRDVVRADLKDPAHRDAVHALVDRADVLIEGFRPGVMERLGLGPDDLLASNPRLVYGRMTGWGQSGALARVAGHDINYVAMSGALGAIGPADRPPVAPVNLLGDFGGGGLLLAFGVLAALVERSRSGRGQVVDAAMVDGARLFTTHLHSMHAEGAWDAGRGENLLDGGAPFYRCYATSDGAHMSVGSLEPEFYAQLVSGLGLDIEQLPAQQDRSGWPELERIFAAAFAARTRAEWTETFSLTDACVQPVYSPVEGLVSPFAADRSAAETVEGVSQPAPTPRFARTPAGPLRLRRDARRAGLASWGLTDGALAALGYDE